MADELPPAVQRFIAEVDEYIRPLERATAVAKAFAKENEEAASAERILARAALEAMRAVDALARENLKLGQSEAGVIAAMKAAGDEVDNLIIKNIELIGAERELADEFKAAVAAIVAGETAAGDVVESLTAKVVEQVAAAKADQAAWQELADKVRDAARRELEAAAITQKMSDNYGYLSRAIGDTSFMAKALGERMQALAVDTKMAQESAESLAETAALVSATYKVQAGAADSAAAAYATLGRATDFVAGEQVKLIATATALKTALGEDSDAAKQLTINLVRNAAGLKSLGAAAAAGGGAGGGRRWFGWLPATIAGMAAWHVILDLLVETLISVGEAALTASVGIAAMAPTIGNIHDYLASIQVVNKALGDQIPGLTTKFDALAKAMAPQTIEVYGGLLNLVKSSLDGIRPLISQVVTLFDDWTARIDIWAKSTGVMNKLLADGLVFLRQFGSLIGYLGDAFKNLLVAMPGIAHLWLDVLIGMARVFDLVTKLPAPLLSAVIGLHGLYMMARLLGGMLMWLARQFGTLWSTVVKLATSPWGWAAIAAAAIAYLAYQASHAQPAIKGLISSMETRLDTENASQAIIQLATDIGTLQDKMHSLNTANVMKQFAGLKNWLTGQVPLGAAAAWGHFINAITAPAHGGGVGKVLSDIGHGFMDIATSGDVAKVAISRDMAAMRAEIDKMTGSSRNLFGETGKLMAQGYSYSQSLALMDLAGVKWNDTAAIMAQKVQNLITGYQQMSISGGLLQNSVNAVTFATLQQDSKVGQLTQSWSAFFTVVTGGESGFVSFAQGMQSLSQAAGKAHGSLTGLSSSSLAARSQFLQTAQAAQTEMNNLMTLASAAGLGARGTRMLAQAGRDMIQPMLGAAKNSRALTTVLYALAQQAGYRGADSFKALSQWVGHTAHPMQNLDKITTKFTVAAGNLTTDVQNLSTALGTQLNAAIAKAAFAASGAQTALDNYATALHDDATGSLAVHDAAQKLAPVLTGLTGNARNAHREFDAMSIAMGISRGTADKLWASVTKTTTATRNVGDASRIATAKLHDLAVQGGDAAAKTASAVDHKLAPLPAKLKKLGQDSVTALAGALHGGAPKAAAAAHGINMAAEGVVSRLAPQFHQAGANATQGLASGILSNEQAAVNAAGQVADAAAAAMRTHLQTRSPSKVTQKIGQDTIAGLIKGLTGGIGQIDAAIKNIVDAIKAAFGKGTIGHGREMGLTAWVEGDNKRLRALAMERKHILAQIKAGDAAYQAVHSSLTGIIGLTHAPAPFTGKVTSPAQMVANLKTEAADMRRFAGDLRKLAALGLDPAIIQRIIAMGPMQGTAYAEAIIAAAGTGTNPGGPRRPGINPGGPQGGPLGGTPMVGGGTPSIIAQLNSAYGQVQALSKSLATQVANSMYGGGAAAGKGLMEGLKSQEHAIDREMRRIADVLVKRLKHDLGIHSPSSVFHDHGLAIDAGLAKGIRDGAPMVRAAVHDLLAGLNPGGIRIPVLAGAGAGGHTPMPMARGGGVNPGGPMDVHVTVELDGMQLGAAVRKVTQRYANRNWQNGLTRRGKVS